MKLRKILSIVLISAMCVTLMPVGVFGAYNGNNTAEGGDLDGGEEITEPEEEKVTEPEEKKTEPEEKKTSEGNSTSSEKPDDPPKSSEVNSTQPKLEQADIKNEPSSDEGDEDSWVTIVAKVISHTFKDMAWDIQSTENKNMKYHFVPHQNDGAVEITEKWSGSNNETGELKATFYNSIPAGTDLEFWLTAMSTKDGQTLSEGVASNSLEFTLPEVGGSTSVPGGSSGNNTDPVKPEPTPEKKDSKSNSGSDDDSNSGSGSSDNSQNVVVVSPVPVGNIIKGKVYNAYVSEFRPFNVNATTTGFNAGNGVTAGVSVDQGGNGFGAYNFVLSGGITGSGTGISLNETYNNAGAKFSHAGNGLYYPEGYVTAQFMVDNTGVAVMVGSKGWLPGLYTLNYLDESGNRAYISVIVGPAGLSVAKRNKATDVNGTMPILGGKLKKGVNYNCVIVESGENAVFAVGSDGSKHFTDRNREEGLYTIFYLDGNGRIAYDVIAVRAKGSGQSDGPSDRNTNSTALVSADITTNAQEIECSIIEYYSNGDENSTGTSMGGEAAKFVVAADGSKHFSDGVYRPDGVYRIVYNDKAGNMTYDSITVGSGKRNQTAAPSDENATTIPGN